MGGFFLFCFVDETTFQATKHRNAYEFSFQSSSLVVSKDGRIISDWLVN